MDNTNQFSVFLIDLMKSIIKKEDLVIEKSTEFITQVGKEIDRCKVNNEPTDTLEYLYDTALWLKSDILKD